jgi:1-acyl-sn-glycerol-3-phosphate acyltransferase
MRDTLYRTIRLLGAPFRYRVIGMQNIQGAGPAIYAANHLTSAGPIESILSLPVRLHPWVVAEMTDLRRAPAYLYDDFIGPSWRVRGRLGLAVSTLVSQLAVRLIVGVGCVPVDRSRGAFLEPFRHSLALLMEGRSLLIFPEDRQGPMEPETSMRPFLPGFLLLCPLYQEAAQRSLPIYPMAVHAASRTISVGKAFFFGGTGTSSREIRQACSRLQEAVRTLYCALQAGQQSGGQEIR